MDIKILYEDEYILALDKPPGLLVHADGKSKEKTLADWINEHYKELKDVGEEQILQNGKIVKRPGIVHRLDKDTSGVILIAKTKETHQYLKEQFQARKVEKIYHAVVWGKFNEDKLEGVIGKPIGRSASDFRKWSAEYGAKGKLREAETEYKVLMQGEINKEKIAYVEARPKTGRTHQIRVHMKSIGHSVVGDKLYGRKMNGELGIMNYEKDDKTKKDRLMLHAVSIKLELPNGTYIKVESSLPEEFENIRKFLKKF